MILSPFDEEKKMFQIILKNRACLRFASVVVNRMCQTEKLTLVSKTKKEDSHLTLKVIDEFPPPVQQRPFDELDVKDEESKERHSDIGEFVDNLTPPLPIGFNLAAFVNQSPSLQKLVQLGVNLSEIEKRQEAAKYILKLDFDRDVKGHIQFLYDHGVKAEDLGKFVCKNPFVFKESLEDLEVRINYLKSKSFEDAAIARILTANPMFLSRETLNVDSRLGFFQMQFSLTGNEVRFLVTKCPKLITFDMSILRENMFVIKEELGFNCFEMKKLLLAKPKVYTLGRKYLNDRFDIIHNTMNFSYSDVLKCPGALLRRSFILKQRHLYLEHLGRVQYNPREPMYVSLSDIALLNDSEFCIKCAKTSVEEYNAFLRTL